MKEFSIVRKGYAPEEVNAYIDSLEKALADRTAQLLEYQEKENAITKSMIDAQLVSAKVRSEAMADAAAMRAGAYDEMDQLREQVSALHGKLSDFQNEYSRILQEYLVSLRSNDLVALFGRLESFMQTISVKNPEEADEEPAPEEDACECACPEECCEGTCPECAAEECCEGTCEEPAPEPFPCENPENEQAQ